MFSLGFIFNSCLTGVGLAMDAFSVSLANGLKNPRMRWYNRFKIAGTFAWFQFMMPMIGWLLVTEAARLFKWFSPLIPWIAMILLLIIGGGLLKDGIEELRSSKAGDTEKDGTAGAEKKRADRSETE